MFKLLMPFIIAIALFAGVELAIGLSPLSVQFDEQNNAVYNFKFQDMEKQHPKGVDVLALGSSRTVHAFSPVAFEKSSQEAASSSYNLGMSSTNMLYYRLLLEDYLREFGKPKLVLLEVAEFNFDREGREAFALGLIRNRLRAHPENIMPFLLSPDFPPELKTKSLLSLASNIYCYRKQFSPKNFRKLYDAIRSRPQANNEVLTLANHTINGWWPLDTNEGKGLEDEEKSIQASANYKVNITWNGASKFDPYYLENILSYCEKEHVPVVLVRWPVYPAFQAVMHKHPQEKAFEQVLARSVAKHKVKFFDLANTRPLDRKDFFDVDHLNELGSKKLTHLLKSKMATEALLTEVKTMKKAGS